VNTLPHAVAVALVLLAGLPAFAGTPPPAPVLELKAPWIETTPDQLGLDAARLEAAAARAAGQPRFRSLLVARHGRLAFERYFGGASAETQFDVRSVTKSVVSLLTGIALREGVFPSLDASIASWLAGPYQVDAEDATVTLRHLTRMTSGFAWNENGGPDYNRWILSGAQVQFLLDRPHAAPAGSVFAYDSAAVHVLGVCLEQAAHEPLADYARERLFEPLGITDAAWEPALEGSVNGGSGIDLRGRDLLKLGQLVLQRGWSGEASVVPDSWIASATAPAFPWRDAYGAQQSVTYGSLFWVSDAAPPAAFAWGYGGQFVYVVPSLELVVVTTTEWRQLSETTPQALAEAALGVIVEEVLPSVRP
jgi:CubicO group peptidase (beta-lactamase class C family)